MVKSLIHSLDHIVRIILDPNYRHINKMLADLERLDAKDIVQMFFSKIIIL